ncbi:hypothetical protein BDN72DRAFT_48436 [Pluteus cervinus]|uniref:Uncharacterized protein n=1 Tax=Pluteus cervinus TaxID=181527 RepID=A0ACD3BHC8_9AGAR|nr:hypothetical protein BDN72DRAFT_48436 [Pluteus cervinus]
MAEWVFVAQVSKPSAACFDSRITCSSSLIDSIELGIPTSLATHVEGIIIPGECFAISLRPLCFPLGSGHVVSTCSHRVLRCATLRSIPIPFPFSSAQSSLFIVYPHLPFLPFTLAPISLPFHLAHPNSDSATSMFSSDSSYPCTPFFESFLDDILSPSPQT